MGTVIAIWLLQWGVIVVVALTRADISGFLGRLAAAILRPSVGLLALGCCAFLLVALRAVSSGDIPGAGFAALSLVFETMFLLGAILAGMFRRSSGADTTFGSAKFATLAHAMGMGLVGSQGVRLGYFRHPDNSRPEQPVPLQYTGQRHILTVAPTRAGKGVSMLVPNLLTYPGSCLVIDPKGELARITYDQRERLGRAIVLDPWNVSGKPAARYNPLASLKADSPTLIEDATLVGDALVLPETEGNGKHFSEQASALVKDFALYLATTPTERQTLGRLREILTMAPPALAKIGIAMSQSPHPVVRSASAQLIGKSEVERAGVISTAQRNTHFLDSPALRVSLDGHNFRFADLKSTQGPTTIYLILPVERLTSHSRWLRLLIAQAIEQLARTPGQPPQPVLFMLDEFAALGRMPIIEDAYGLMAGMGMMLQIVVQDLAQLRRIYGEGWQTFAANAGVMQFFGTRDLFTAQYVSDLIGKTTTTLRSTSSSSGSTSSPQGGGSNNSSSVSLAPTQRPLLFPDELMRMPRDAQVLFVENADPILSTKIVWHQDPAYRPLGVIDPGAPVLDMVPPSPPSPPPHMAPHAAAAPPPGAGPTAPQAQAA